MPAGKCREIRRLAIPQKPQLACRHVRLHASCTIPKITCFHNVLFYKDLIGRVELAHCLQYPC